MLHSRHHHPPHIFRDNTIYFITARTIKKESQRKLETFIATSVEVSDYRRDSLQNTNMYFYNNARKDVFVEVFKKSIKKYDIKIFAWVLLDNHYHLLIKINKKEALTRFIQNLHANSARLLNKLDNTKGRKIWYQYWDHCIRDEKDFYKHFNYIHNNPIKHKKAANLQELKKYKFSSFNSWIEKKGGEWINSCFEIYPIFDFIVDNN
jgi:REP element-mobilizing transposase RayT